MPKNKDAYDYVTTAGLIALHDVEAVEALYPGTFDASLALHAPKFTGGDPTASRTHLGALIAADLWQKRGGKQVDENIDARIQSAKNEAEAYLAEPRGPAQRTTPSYHPGSIAPKADT